MRIEVDFKGYAAYPLGMLDIRHTTETERGAAQLAAPARRMLVSESGEVNTGARTDRPSKPERSLSAETSTLPQSEAVAEVEASRKRSRLGRAISA